MLLYIYNKTIIDWGFGQYLRFVGPDIKCCHRQYFVCMTNKSVLNCHITLTHQVQHAQALTEMETAGRRDAERRAKNFEDKLRILTSPPRDAVEHDINVEVFDRGRFKRHRIAECRRCHACLPSDDYCKYHDKAPLQVLVKDSNGHVTRPLNQKFWPCCGKTSVREPEGCRIHPSHQSI